MGSTLVNGLFLQLLLTFTVLVSTSDGQLNQSDINRIDTGLRLGQEIANLLETGTIPEVLKTVAANFGPFLDVFGPALSLIFPFITTPSAELEAIKELKEHIDIRFDRLEVRVSDIERIINWTAVNGVCQTIEQNIHVMSQELSDLWKVPKRGFENRKNTFMEHYGTVYTLSGKKLYNLMKDSGTFLNNLGQSIMMYTKNDLAKMDAYIRGILKLVLEASKIELTYWNLKGDEANANYSKDQWINRTMSLKKTFEEIRVKVKDAYYDQSRKDTQDIVNAHAELSNKDLSNLLYEELTRKYYWRDWIVLVYDPVTGGRLHGIETCDGGIFFRINGHNVVTGSVEKSKPVLDLTRARQTLLEVREAREVFHYHYYMGIAYITEPFEAYRILDFMDTSFACTTAIVAHRESSLGTLNLNLHANFTETRGVSVQRSYFIMIMFG